MALAYQNPVDKEVPMVCVLRPPLVFTLYEKQLSRKFKFLKAWEFPIPTDQFLDRHARLAEVLLCSNSTEVTADVLRRLPSLRCIVNVTAGLEHIDLSECRRRGIAVTYAGSIFSEDAADSAVALLIDVLRRITAADRYVRGVFWPIQGDYPLGSKLGGKRVGIVGLGSIGLEVAKRLEAFGCTISYNSRKTKPSVSFPFYPNVLGLVADSDVLIICCALTDQTHHIINKEVLLALGKQGVIVNVARGAVIDEKELVRCLAQRDIAGAGLDVFENEPEVPKELFALDNVVLSPHQAVCTEESFLGVYELVSGNLEAFFSNKPFVSPIVNGEMNDSSTCRNLLL